ncbi:DUF5677 domain-containing protein [Enterobacter mori]|uniref:DUF5677 domain-containing protein n=1 Tax=Enterobacter mori TaxID=539813 RepID=UPI003D6475D1
MGNKKSKKLCPCGSGINFENCCKSKNFEFVQDNDDSYTIKMPLNEEMVYIFDECKNHFIRVFEREPGEEDPLFLGRYLFSERDVTRDGVEAMHKAGINPAIIYAYKKTGYLLAEENLDKYTGKVLQEWDNAIDEYNQYGGDPADSEDSRKFDEILNSLSEDIECTIYAMGLANDKFLNSLLYSKNDELSMLSVEQYQALCVCRAHKTLRTIYTLKEKQFSEDIIKLTRTIYESYLHIIVVQHEPKAIFTLVDAVVGMKNGTYEYKKNDNGKENRRIKVNAITGEEYPDQISNYRMAASSKCNEDIEFFDYFYTLSSQFIHPSILSVEAYISEVGFDPVKPHMDEEAVIFTALVAAMVLDCIPEMNGCPTQVALDCKTIVSRIRNNILTLINIFDVWINRTGASKSELEIIKQRCNILSNFSER